MLQYLDEGYLFVINVVTRSVPFEFIHIGKGMGKLDRDGRPNGIQRFVYYKWNMKNGEDSMLTTSYKWMPLSPSAFDVTIHVGIIIEMMIWNTL